MCKISDKPVAVLMADLMSPIEDDHNPWSFSMWIAGGGVKKSQVIAGADEIGIRAVERPIHAHDLHATIMHLMGLDHLRVTFLHNGLSERATVTTALR
jgi:hypothetical protein